MNFVICEHSLNKWKKKAGGLEYSESVGISARGNSVGVISHQLVKKQ